MRHGPRLILAICMFVWNGARRGVRGKGGMDRAQVNGSRGRRRDVGVVAACRGSRFDASNGEFTTVDPLEGLAGSTTKRQRMFAIRRDRSEHAREG